MKGVLEEAKKCAGMSSISISEMPWISILRNLVENWNSKISSLENSFKEDVSLKIKITFVPKFECNFWINFNLTI